MVKHLALLLYISLLFACNNKNSKPDYASLIKGDWQGQEQPEGFEHDQTEFLSFEDSTVNAGMGEALLPYKLVNDTLYFTDGNEETGKFTIVTLTTDSLILLSGKRQQNTIRYSRINAKNNITPAFIYYADPKIYNDPKIPVLEIDSSRNVRFFSTMPIMFGAYKGKLSEKVYQSIISKIRALPVDSLKAHYIKPDKDNDPVQVSLVHENKVTRFSAYRYSPQSVELHILFDKLMHLNAEVNEQRDTSLQWEYFESNPILKSMLNERLPPPPPPTIEMRHFTPPKLED